MRRFWIVPTSLLLLTTAIVVDSSFNSLQTGQIEARTALASIATVLGATLAVTVSIMMLTSQFVSQAYSPRASQVLFEDTIFRGYLVLYTSAITAIFGTLAFGSVYLPRILIYALFLFAFCQLYLLFLLFHVPNVLQPHHVIGRITKKIPTNFCDLIVTRVRGQVLYLDDQDEPLIALEQILLRSIAGNDYRTFIEGVEELESVLSSFLEGIGREEVADPSKRLGVNERVSPATNYFMRIYRQLISESISTGREQHLAFACESLRMSLITLHRISASRAFEEAAKVYDYSGMAGMEKSLITFMENYVWGLYDLVRTQLTILDGPVYPYDLHPRQKQWAQMSEQERGSELRVMDFDNLYRSRLRFLAELAGKAAEKRDEFVVRSCMHSFQEAIEKSLMLTGVKKKRGVLTLILLYVEDAHKKSVTHGISEIGLLIDALPRYIEKMNADEEKEVGSVLMRQCARMATIGFNAGTYTDVWTWGIVARSLVKEHPDEAMVALDVLADSLESLKKNSRLENRWFEEQALKDLELLSNWDNHSHEAVTRKVKELLVKLGKVNETLPT